ncbi:MAG: TIGR00266 family protein [Deltaproteobacteria bacterium]|nr:TIGR00266 family protein [Deltaproteobacteria bacterium]
MQTNILYRPAHTIAQVALSPGESIVAESGAMIGMSSNVQIATQSGGIMKGLKRMLLGGESFFRNTFTAHGGPGEVLLAHALCGDIVPLEMTQAGYYVTSSSFIASSPSIEIDTKSQGLRGLFSGEGLFSLKATGGPGTLIVGAFGGIQELVCDGSLVIDTGHLVCWDTTLQYKVGKSGSGWIASMLSGEGLVCHFQGQGRIWIQSRNPQAYGQAVAKVLPPRQG